MSFLKEVYEALEGQRNQKVSEIGTRSDINISIGDNCDWISEDDYDFKEEGVLINDKLIALLEANNVEFSDELREDFHFMREGEEIEVYFKDKSGLYTGVIFLEHLVIDGLQYFDAWIDFNNLCLESNKKDLSKLSFGTIPKY